MEPVQPIAVEPGVIVTGYKGFPGENLGLSFPRLSLTFPTSSRIQQLFEE